MSGAALLRALAQPGSQRERSKVCGQWWSWVLEQAARSFRGAPRSGGEQDDRDEAIADVALRIAATAAQVLDRLATDHPALRQVLLDGAQDDAMLAVADRLVRGYVGSALRRALIDSWRRRRKHEVLVGPATSDDDADPLDRVQDETFGPADGLARRDIERLLDMTVSAAAESKTGPAADAFRARVSDLVSIARGDLDMDAVVLREAEPPPPAPLSKPWRTARDTLLRGQARARADLEAAVDDLVARGDLEPEDARLARQVLLALRRKS